jgi:hypothetical protein
MNGEAFIDICEKSFSEAKVRLGPMQREIYLEKLKRFSNPQLEKVFEKVLETSKRFPKIAEIYEAARECGYLQTESDIFKPHRWQPADCGLCRGEGRLAIIWHCFYEPKPTGLLEIQELVQAFPYTRSFDYTLKPNEYRSIFRCRCVAGDVATLSKAWPKWTKDSETRRERWA